MHIDLTLAPEDQCDFNLASFQYDDDSSFVSSGSSSDEDADDQLGGAYNKSSLSGAVGLEPRPHGE